MATGMKKKGPPEYAGEMGEVMPAGRKGGSKAGNSKQKNKGKKKH